MVITTRRRLLLMKKIIILKLLILLVVNRKKRVQKRRWWVNKLWRKRRQEGAYHTLVQEMRLHDKSMFHCFLRMEPAVFDHLLGIISKDLRKWPKGRPALSAGHRLALTLRYLASGDSVPSIAFAFRVGFTTAKRIIYDTCDVLWNVLQPLYLPSPTNDTWKAVAAGFEKKWNFPHCLGAVDEKHVVIQAPHNSGTMYYNYKGTFSIVLMAVVDADYKFVTVDIGGYGSHSDGGLFKASELGISLEEGTLDIPPYKCLPHSQLMAPYVFIGDEGFQLRKDFMRPFPNSSLDDIKRVFNYRLCRARRCVENAFGILASRWRIFRQPLLQVPANAEKLVKACIVLHNYLRIEKNNTSEEQTAYCPRGYADFTDVLGNYFEGQWRNHLEANPSLGLRDLGASSARNFSSEAGDVRMAFAKYFLSQEGQVPWQWTVPGLDDRQP